MKNLLLNVAIATLCCCQACSNKSDERSNLDGNTIIEFETASKRKEQWVLQIGDPVTTSIGFETDKDGKCSIELPIDTVRPIFLYYPSAQFIAKTWVQPGEICNIVIDRSAAYNKQIRTNGAFAERTKANYSDEFGAFYQLTADDNFKVPLNGKEDEFVTFLIESYSAHMDTITSHVEWSPAMTELAKKTLNDKQYYRLTNPNEWLDVCASLRDFHGIISPITLSDSTISYIYNVTIGTNE